MLCFVLRLTGRLFPAALVSLLWGVHPLHVESVTWVAERRDVLFAFFSLSSLIVYLGGMGPPRPAWRRHASLALFVLACLSKAMAVSLPIVLLLLERRRSPPARVRDALRRVLPFLLVAIGFLLITARIRAAAGDLTGERAAAVVHNVLLASYATLFYLRKTLLPLELSALYPYPDQVGLDLPWPYLAAPAVLAALVTALWFLRRDRDTLFGALFFAATVGPVVLFVPAPFAVVTDRYSYFPSIGILFVLGSALDRSREALRRRSPRAAAALAALLAVASLCLGTLTWRREQVWRDYRTLWEDVLRQFPSSHAAHTILGSMLVREGRAEQGKWHYLQALGIRPDYCLARFRLGVLLHQQGNDEEAAEQFRLNLAACPGDTVAHEARAGVLEALGRDAEAEPHRKAVVAARPRDPFALTGLAANLLRRGHAGEAIPHLRELVRLLPDVAPHHNNLGVALAQLGQFTEAAAEFRTAIRLDPAYRDPRNNLDAILPLLERAP